MPTFQDLPMELVAMTWGFVDEPEDIESFALVSKNVHTMSKPFLQEHARLKRLAPKVSIDVGTEPNGPREVLEQLLKTPRLALYVRKALVEDWRTHRSERNTSVKPLSPERRAKFESAVRCSSHIPPSEKDDWVREIKRGNPDPIIALIMMRLTKLRHLGLVYPHNGGNAYLFTALKQMALAPDGANNLGSSVTRTGPNGGSQASIKPPSPFCKIKEMEIILGSLEMDMLSSLLQGVKNLESLDISSLLNTNFDYHRLNRELLQCSRETLQKLVLHDETESQRFMGRLTGFQNLVKLSVNASLLLSREDEQRRRLVDMLPTSIQALTLYLGDTAGPHEVEEVVNQVFECKMECCQRLQTFWIEMENPVEMDEEEKIRLKERLAEVGIGFEVGEY